MTPVPRLVPALLGALTALTGALAAPGVAAAVCPGGLPSGTCAYTAQSQVGQRTGGVLRFPQAVAVGDDGAVYVADQKTHAITVFNPDGTFRRDYGSSGFKPGEMSSVGGVAVAGDGSVLVTSANRVDRFAKDGSLMRTWGKTGQGVGEFNFGSGGGNDSPAGGGLAVSGNLVYVADSRNDRLQRFTLDGKEGRVLVAPGQLQTPMGVAVRGSRVFVADDQNHRIALFDSGGTYLNDIGDGEGSSGGQLKNPYDVGVDPKGRVFVADDLNQRVVRYSPLSGSTKYRYKARWGSYGTAPGRLAYPRGIAVDKQGLIYVTNTGNDRIDVFDRGGKLLRSMGRSGRGSGQFDTPSGVSADASGIRAVADSVNGRVQFLGPDGSVVSVMGSPSPGPTILPDPVATAFDAQGNAYVLDQRRSRIVVFSRQTGLPVRTIASKGTGFGQLMAPSSLSITPGGTIYVADTGNQRVARFTVAGQPLASLPVVGAPRGVAVTPDAQRIYVSTTKDNRIRTYAPDGTQLNVFGGLGRKIGKLAYPAQISLGPDGDLWVADRGNSRVQRFGPDGERLAAFGSHGTGPGQFLRPDSVAVDCHGTVTVTDTDNNRVQQFALADPPQAPCASLPPVGVPPTPKYPVLPPPDGPAVTVKVLRRSSLLRTRNLPLRVGCDTGCTLTATGTLTPRAKPKRPKRKKGQKKRPPAPKPVVVALRADQQQIAAGSTGLVRLKLSTTSMRRLRKALGRHRGLLAEVQITASGDAGEPTSQTLILKVLK